MELSGIHSADFREPEEKSPGVGVNRHHSDDLSLIQPTEEIGHRLPIIDHRRSEYVPFKKRSDRFGRSSCPEAGRDMIEEIACQSGSAEPSKADRESDWENGGFDGQEPPG